MDELLKKLFESDVLTPETKQELITSVQAHITEQVELAKKEATEATQAKLVEQWVSEREILIQAMDAKLDQFMESELSQFSSDVARYRDLEVEYAEKLAESKASMAVELQDDMAVLLRKIDIFLEDRLQAEFNELREDIEIAKKDRFGRQIFEAFSNMYSTKFVDENSVAAKLAEAEELNATLTSQLLESEKATEKLQRSKSVSTLLAPLSGRNREIMETILESTATESLSDTYNKFITRIVEGSVSPSTEKEVGVLAEGDNKKATKTVIEEGFVVKNGDDTSKKVNEGVNDVSLDPAFIARLKLLSGQI